MAKALILQLIKIENKLVCEIKNLWPGLQIISKYCKPQEVISEIPTEGRVLVSIPIAQLAESEIGEAELKQLYDLGWRSYDQKIAFYY